MQNVIQVLGAAGLSHSRAELTDAVMRLAKLPTPTICPCCKSAISVKIPIVDLNTNTVSWQGKSTKLTPKQAELTTLLLNKFPGAETHRKIEQGMWGMGEMVEANNLIKVFVTQLRHKLQPLNVTVLNVRGYGYRLELAQ